MQGASTHAGYGSHPHARVPTHEDMYDAASTLYAQAVAFEVVNASRHGYLFDRDSSQPASILILIPASRKEYNKQSQSEDGGELAVWLGWKAKTQCGSRDLPIYQPAR